MFFFQKNILKQIKCQKSIFGHKTTLAITSCPLEKNFYLINQR